MPVGQKGQSGKHQRAWDPFSLPNALFLVETHTSKSNRSIHPRARLSLSLQRSLLPSQLSTLSFVPYSHSISILRHFFNHIKASDFVKRSINSGKGMESSVASTKKGKFVRTIAKILHLRASIGIAADDVLRKRKVGKGKSKSSSRMFEDERTISESEKAEEEVAMEAFLARLFASISSIKASYAQIQLAQCQYNGDEIRSADQLVISELTLLSEMKLCYVKKQFDFSPEKVMALAEIQEQNSALKTYEIMIKRLEIQSKIQDSETKQFRALFEERDKQNKLMQRRLNETGQLCMLDNVHPSGLNPTHFITVLHHTVRSIRSFVRILVNEMDSAGWDLNSAASTISPGVVYWKDIHRCFAFESYISLEMFNGFQHPWYHLQHHSFKDTKAMAQYFYKKFHELKSTNIIEDLSSRPNSTFWKFCQMKYLTLIHPDMELSLCRDLTQRNLLKLGQFPKTTFFTSFAEMAKRVWMLHCLAFSFNPPVSIFQIRPSSRYSEVYMESVADEPFLGSNTDPMVALTVVPGFKISKTVLHCQVYLSKK